MLAQQEFISVHTPQDRARGFAFYCRGLTKSHEIHGLLIVSKGGYTVLSHSCEKWRRDSGWAAQWARAFGTTAAGMTVFHGIESLIFGREKKKESVEETHIVRTEKHWEMHNVKSLT